MRVDIVLRDIATSVRQLLLALDNRLTAEENFAPEGERGQVLTSNGPGLPPSYQDAGAGSSSGGNTTVVQDIGVVAEGRLVGRYARITQISPQVVAYANPMTGEATIPSGFDMLVMSTYEVEGTLTVAGRLVVL